MAMSKSTLRGEIVGKLKEYSPVSIVGRRETADAILRAVLEALPEKIDIAVMNEVLRQGKPQRAASYNGFNAAIDQVKAILESELYKGGEK